MMKAEAQAQRTEVMVTLMQESINIPISSIKSNTPFLPSQKLAIEDIVGMMMVPDIEPVVEAMDSKDWALIRTSSQLIS